MRTLIDIEDKAVTALDRIAREEGVSRSALIREAVADFLQRRRATDMEEAFGLWSGPDAPRDGLEHQKRMRAEW